MSVSPEETPVRERLAPLRGDQVRPLHAHLGAGALHLALAAITVLALRAGWWLALPPLWCAIAWLDHAALTRLHEAAHGMLARARTVNEAMGFLIGAASLTPLSVYRYVHSQHHAHLGRERDPEFWPYNLPGSPRWLRLTYAWAELLGGWLLTPALYSVRTAAAWRTLRRGQRRRLLAEWVSMLALWLAVLALVHARGWWPEFLAAHLAPAWLAGTMQTVRKFTEHLGMHGRGVLGMTRTVVYRGAAGDVASRSQLHVEHHATHHRHARIPYHRLPEATEIVYGADADAALFPNHLRAIADMLPSLLDPRLGPQWLETRRESGSSPVCPS